MSGSEGQVLVAVTVVTSNRGAENQQPPRSWRMRLTVKKTGEDEAKVSKVEFVP
jgi:Mce-associated membrane protein